MSGCRSVNRRQHRSSCRVKQIIVRGRFVIRRVSQAIRAEFDVSTYGNEITVGRQSRQNACSPNADLIRIGESPPVPMTPTTAPSPATGPPSPRARAPAISIIAPWYPPAAPRTADPAGLFDFILDVSRVDKHFAHSVHRNGRSGTGRKASAREHQARGDGQFHFRVHIAILRCLCRPQTEVRHTA
jgi:hypothetical protein